MPGTKGGLWTYRRLIDSALFGTSYPADLSMFNWPGNDYREASIIDRPAHEVAAALQDAKRASLGFLHWVQTEAPAEGDRLGAPELRLRPDIMGSADGLAKFPYIRESRRIKALRTVVEQDVSAHFQKGPRAAHFEDSVGVGWYPIDIHRAGPGGRRHQLPHPSVSDPARRPHPGPRPQPDRGGQEHRHDPHHQRLLPPAPRRVEHRRGGRRARGLLPRPGQIRGGGPPGRGAPLCLPAQSARAKACRSPGPSMSASRTSALPNCNGPPCSTVCPDWTIWHSGPEAPALRARALGLGIVERLQAGSRRYLLARHLDCIDGAEQGAIALVRIAGDIAETDGGTQVVTVGT